MVRGMWLLYRMIAIEELPRWEPTTESFREYWGQHAQDRWVVESVFSNGKRGGYFVEAGAGDGRLLSNTLVLEKEFSWSGLLIEPTSAYQDLVQNRTSPAENCCLGATSDTVLMAELPSLGLIDEVPGNNLRSMVLHTTEPLQALSELQQRLAPKILRRFTGPEIPIVQRESRRLDALLDRHNAPRIIDFLSLDVEGYEWEVLKNFDFDRYTFRCAAIERPEDRLRELLLSRHYVEVARAGSDVLYLHGSMTR